MKKHICSDDCYYWRNNIKHPKRLTERQKEIVREKLRDKGRDWYQTRLIVDRLARRFRVSKSTIYRHSRMVRFPKRGHGKSAT